MKFDITKPIVLKKGMYKLNKNEEFSYQMGRLVNADGADLECVKAISGSIHDNASWKKVLLKEAKRFDSQKDIKNAGGFYRMAEFYMEWDDPDALKAWKRARELFFEYYADYFEGENPVVERFEIPFEGYTMPCMKLNPCHPAAFSFTDKKKPGVIVMNGGFDSSYEEFFPAMEYLRENGYVVYLFEGPGQGACIRLHHAPLTLEWEKPVKALLDYCKLQDVCLIGASLGGYFSPRAAAFENRITSFVSWPAFPSLRANIDASSKLIWPLAKFFVKIFHGAIDRSYEKAVRRNKFGALTDALKVYYHRLGCGNVRELIGWFEAMDMKPYGDRITQDVLLLGGEKDAMISSKIYREQKAEMPNAKSVRVRILTDADEASDHCNFGNIKLAMDVVLEWFDGVNRKKA